MSFADGAMEFGNCLLFISQNRFELLSQTNQRTHVQDAKVIIAEGDGKCLHKRFIKWKSKICPFR